MFVFLRTFSALGKAKFNSEYGVSVAMPSNGDWRMNPLTPLISFTGLERRRVSYAPMSGDWGGAIEVGNVGRIFYEGVECLSRSRRA